MATDFEAKGLLGDLAGAERDARRRLLEELEADGVPLDELREAVAQDRLALLPVERELGGGDRRYTAREIADRAGVELEFLSRQWQALGFATADEDDPVYGESDLRAAERVRMLLDAGLPPEGILETARVIGLAMSQVAAASNALVGAAMLRPGDTEHAAAHRYVAASRALRPGLGEAMAHVLDLHLREQVRQAAVGQAQLAEGRLPGAQEVTACFADLVGFTRLGERIAVEDLGDVTGRLSELVSEAARAPVRLVKMIGDAAMLVSQDNDAVIETALDLVAAAATEDDFPEIRAGLARGPALPRAGDWYGRPINLASRITGVARPGTVVCAEEVRDAGGDGYRWSHVGRRHLKGVRGTLRLFRVRRAG